VHSSPRRLPSPSPFFKGGRGIFNLPAALRAALFSACSLFAIRYSLFVILLSLPLAAANLLTNPGFELPVLSHQNTSFSGVQGWDVGGFPGYATVWARPAFATTPCPEGNQHVMGSVNQLYLSQEPLTIQSNTTYIFSVDLYRMNPQGDANVAYVGFVDATAGGYLALKQFTTNTKDFVFLTDQWTRVSVEFNSANAPAAVGHVLRVVVDSWLCAIDNASLASGSYARTFYISSSDGSDLYDGLSSFTPWRSFSNLNTRTLLPGESVLLKRGDEWRQELHLRGKGTVSLPITLADYGLPALPRPRIRRYDVEFDRCVVIENASHWLIHDLDLRLAKIGLYLRYNQDYDNTNVVIYNLHVQDLTDETLDPPKHDYELAWSMGIFVGGKTGGPLGHPLNYRTVLDGIAVSNCTFIRCAMGFGNAWYYPEPYKGRIRNVLVSDCLASNCINGTFAFFDLDGGLATRCRSIFGGADVWCGTALGFLQSAKNFVIDNCEFAAIDRRNSGDGSGFDYEGDCHNMIFANNVVHDCSSAALLSLTTGGANTNILYPNNTFYNNSVNPWNDEIAREMYCGFSGNIGLVSNCGLYTGYNADAHLSPDWGGHIFLNNRYGYFSNLYTRTHVHWWDWETNGNFQGWGSPNHLSNLEVSGGALRAVSSGDDPFIHSAPIWTPALATRHVWIRMSQTAGAFAQIFWITETDPVWDGAKSTFFPINPDGQMYEYWVDLIAAGAKGLITQVRLDPTIASGSSMAIDFVRMTEFVNTNSAPPAARAPWPLQTTLVGQTTDNWMLENGYNTGTGGSIGTVTDAALRVGDAANNAAYRAIVSFDTSPLPDNAIIVDATLGLRRSSITGKEPWTYNTTLIDSDYCEFDMRVPYFGAESGVVISDWQAAVSLTNVGRYVIAFKNGLQVRDQLTPAARALINPGAGGTAQFRLHFPRKTNNDGVADYVSFGSANHGTASYRPILKINYRLP